ncbi:hypothetical protein R6Q59_027162 [Mikania micrantha]|uniref:Transcription repressor n=1 Tax=Mikania micrantha TaxID=192012 RepID=A0A5N6MEE6_9ASTR|nr:hypothetical protein E3N88_33639 [Mikania micrantha]
MGNYRFRFSNIIPNSWFYSSITGNKVKNKLTKTQPISTSSSSSFPSAQSPNYQRKSYYFTRELIQPDPKVRTRDFPPTDTQKPDPRRKSSKKKRPISPKKQIRRKLVSPELNPAGRITPESGSTGFNSSDTEVMSPDHSLSCSCKTTNSYDDVYGKVDLPPIITKPAKHEEFGSGKWVIDGGKQGLTVKVAKDGITRSPVRKLKGNGYSPRLGNRVRVNGINGGRRKNGSRRSLSESMAVVKTSVDPGRDFRESMVEMITVSKMKSSKDLEDLLACYLALNSDEYHELIINVFKQIWFECTDIRL